LEQGIRDSAGLKPEKRYEEILEEEVPDGDFGGDIEKTAMVDLDVMDTSQVTAIEM